MEGLNKDLIIFLALDLDLITLIKLCATNKKFNNLICNNNIFWMNRLHQDYPNTLNKFSKDSNFKKIYISLKNKVVKYYTYVIENEDPNIINISDYVKKFKELRNIRLKIYETNTIEKNTFKVIGDFPSGTKLWVTNGIGFLTKREAFEEFENNNCLKYYIDEDFINFRNDFLDENRGMSPEELYGFKYNDAFSFYKKKLEDDNFIVHKSFDDCFDIYILKEITIP